ncbi:FMN-dependent NADH-azoreductase [Salinimonas sediminis]|uniref:FMN dependent NADH:quinone oxidoreductase n=1 Tax=Salinimonas sediminis TaxID=2303538 RepID=A0A346NLI7_9ALTE|nr:NAD(P)H-dependent oxidoreductase [Salinimonas sediminis]AXR06394.1 FMN-dependent NADH-azoreductase [Salinimonas sediminis]
MTNVLVLKSSLNQTNGNSNKLINSYIAKLTAQHTVSLAERDLAAQPLSHLSEQEMAAWMTEPAKRSDEQQALAALSDNIVAEVMQADHIVIGVPMYNFGIPSVLKAWIDRVARAGITFKYTDTGPVGLLEGKSVTILAARGGQYQGTEFDTQSRYLEHFFNFIGITDINFVYAEGLAMGAEAANQAFDAADKKIVELIEQAAD